MSIGDEMACLWNELFAKKLRLETTHQIQKIDNFFVT